MTDDPDPDQSTAWMVRVRVTGLGLKNYGNFTNIHSMSNRAHHLAQ